MQLTDPEDNATKWTYDGLNQVTKETNAWLKDRTYAYDAAGNLLQETDRNGKVRFYKYDNLHRRTQELWQQGSSITQTISFAYDAASQLVSAGDSAAKYLFQYDTLGRQTESAATITGLGSTVTLNSTFDKDGLRKKLTGRIGTVDDLRVDYSYDPYRRLQSIEQKSQPGGAAVNFVNVQMGLNVTDQLTLIIRSASNMPDGSNRFTVGTSSLAYDGAGRLSDVTHKKGIGTSTITVADYDWTYDQANRVKTFTSLKDGKATYTYDARGQETHVAYTTTASGQTVPLPENYGYDDNGNRASGAGQFILTGLDNRTTSDNYYTYEYDHEGNRTRRADIGAGWEENTWDNRQRLVKVVEKSANGTVLKTVDYTYDVFDRKIVKNVTPAAGIQTRDYWIYDGNQPVLEFHDENSAAYTAPRLSHRYLWGAAVDQLLTDEQIPNCAPNTSCLSNQTYWALTDNLGSVRDVQDNSGTIRQHVAYDSFGNRVVELDYDGSGALLSSPSATDVDVLFGYTGRDWDSDTSLQYNRARWYDPRLGRWLSVDPIGFSAGDPNLYRYVQNSPTNATDPTGLEKRHVFGQSRWELQEETAYAYEERIRRSGPLGAGFYTLGMELHQMGNVMWTAWDSDVIDWRAERLLQKSRNCGVQDPGAGQLTWEFTKDYVIPVDPAADAFVGFDRLEQRTIEGDELVQRRVLGISQMAGVAAVGAGGVTRVASGVGSRTIPSGISASQRFAHNNLTTPSGGILRRGATLYRVHGGAADEHGLSWSTVCPTTVPNYRAAAGLFPGNSGQSVTAGVLLDTEGVLVKPPMPGPTTPPGAIMVPEIIVPHPALQIKPITTFDVTPPF